MIKEKKGFEWSVTKLMIVILSLVVLALIIYGLTHGGFGPLFSKVQATVNEVLIFLGLRDGSSGFNCKEIFLKEVVDDALIKEMGGDGTSKFGACNNDCNITLSDFDEYQLYGRKTMGFDEWTQEYSYSNPVFKKLNAGRGVPYDKYLKGNLRDNEFLRELYEKIDNYALGSVKILEFYENRMTDRFIMFWEKEEGKKSSKDVFAIWEDGNWNIFKRGDIYNHSIQRYAGRVLYYGPSYDKMLQVFELNRREHYEDYSNYNLYYPDYNVYYKTVPSRHSIYRENKDYLLEGEDREGNWEDDDIKEIFGGNNQLDDDPDFDNLKKYFGEKKAELSKSLIYTEEEFEEFKSKIKVSDPLDSSKWPVVGGVKYSVGEIEISDGLPIITAVSEDKSSKYGLRFYPSASVVLPISDSSSSEVTPIRYLPLELVKFEDDKWISVGDERDYRLSEEDWKEFLRVRKIKNFLNDFCGEL